MTPHGAMLMRSFGARKERHIVRVCFSRGSRGKVGKACVSVPLGIRSKSGTAHHIFSLTMRAIVADRMALGIVRLRSVLTNPLVFAMLTFDSGFRRLGHGVLFFQHSEVAMMDRHRRLLCIGHRSLGSREVVSFVIRTTSARSGSTALAFLVVISLTTAGSTQVRPERYVPMPVSHACARIVPTGTGDKDIFSARRLMQNCRTS